MARTIAPHFAPRAKQIIYLFMAGAPSQIDLFDHKPKLQQYDGQPIPADIVKGERFAFIKGTPRLLGSPFTFQKHGRSAAEMSTLLPHLAKHADEIAIVRSMTTTQFNHAPGQIFMNTGHQIIGRPSLGSWLSYGLGSENTDLPAFVVLMSGQNNPDGGKSCWGSGFLPTQHQGVEFRSKGEPVLFSANPEGVDAAARRESLDLVGDLNRAQHAETNDPETVTRIAAYELAYRMQTSVPELTDVDGRAGTHPRDVRHRGRDRLVRQQLPARAPAGRTRGPVRPALSQGLGHPRRLRRHRHRRTPPALCLEIDRAVGALLTDLKARGLLDTTLVVWGGEFGRTPINEARNGSKLLGRDHHPRAFTMWMAGGGIKPGVTIGRTDDLGYNVVEDPVDVHDLHATLLHLMGYDHKRLTYKFQGRDFRLTDVSGNVVQKLLA